MANIRKMFFYFNGSVSSEKGVKEIVVSWNVIQGSIHGMTWSEIREYFVQQSLRRHCCRWIISDVSRSVSNKFQESEVFGNDYFEFHEPVAPAAPVAPEVPEMEQSMLELPEEVVPEIA